MGKCVVCGNEYARSFDILAEGSVLTFDSFECAIHRLAPGCGHCGCRIIGHGIEGDNALYCCAHCAREAGVEGAVDHPGARP
jgi:Zn finger protein HypA/HybF involved in hydrogenase expression